MPIQQEGGGEGLPVSPDGESGEKTSLEGGATGGPAVEIGGGDSRGDKHVESWDESIHETNQEDGKVIFCSLVIFWNYHDTKVTAFF